MVDARNAARYAESMKNALALIGATDATQVILRRNGATLIACGPGRGGAGLGKRHAIDERTFDALRAAGAQRWTIGMPRRASDALRCRGERGAPMPARTTNTNPEWYEKVRRSWVELQPDVVSAQQAFDDAKDKLDRYLRTPQHQDDPHAYALGYGMADKKANETQRDLESAIDRYEELFDDHCEGSLD